MFRASSAHLQEDIVVYMQPMVYYQIILSCQQIGGLSCTKEYLRQVAERCYTVIQTILCLNAVYAHIFCLTPVTALIVNVPRNKYVNISLQGY